MANQIEWEGLSPIEAETLSALESSGKEVYAAPIEIDNEDRESRNRHLEALGITMDDCRTWHIGSETVLVHLTPADEETYKFLLGSMRAKHRTDYRHARCKVPGKQKYLINCPDTNSCSDCPYGRKAEDREPNKVSWDVLSAAGWEGEIDTSMTDQLQAKLEYEEIRVLMDAENPLIAEILEMKVLDGYTVSEISGLTGVSKRNVYYYLERAKAIGQKYNE